MQTSSTILKRKPRLYIRGKWSLNLNNGECSIPSTTEHFQKKWFFFFIMQKPTRGKTQGRTTPGCRYYKTHKRGADWAAFCSMPSITQASLTSLRFYKPLEYNHHHTFLCDYCGNSNLGKIKINMTETICAKQGSFPAPQKQLGYLKYERWTKTTYQMEKSFLLFSHSWEEKQLNTSESSVAPLQQQHLSRARNGSQNYPSPPTLRCPHSSLLVGTGTALGCWSLGLLAPGGRKRQILRLRDDYAQHIQNLQAGT